MKRRLWATVAAFGMAAVSVLLADPAQAGVVDYGNPNATIGFKNSPASYRFDLVQFRDDTYGTFYLDTVVPGDSKGEGTFHDVFSEPTQFRIAPHEKARWRIWYGTAMNGSNATAGAFTTWWYDCSTIDSWHTTVALNNHNLSGYYLYEIELLPAVIC